MSSRIVGPTQKVRCKGGKHYVDPTRIEGPPRLRTSGGTWELIALYRPQRNRNSQDTRLERLFSKTAKSKK